MRVFRRLGTVLSLLVAMVATSLVMGLLAAGLLIPVVGGTGLASNKAIDLFNGLPSNIAMNPLAQQSEVLAADGSVISTPFTDGSSRVVVPLKKVSKVMLQAQIAIEDERFYQHGGIDPKGLIRALTTNAQGGAVQGASTLTQQYVKVKLQNDATAAGNSALAAEQTTQTGLQGYIRKLQQLKYAIALEQKYTKNQILDGYLNIVPYGDQQIGVEATAEHYFSVHASQLTLPQAALLAGIVNAPTDFNPRFHPAASMNRRNTVLLKMYQQKLITFNQYSAASAIPVAKMLKVKFVNGNCSASKYPYFCTYVTDWLKQQPALGKTPQARLAMLQGSGLIVRTTFQPKMAAIINAKLRAKVPQDNKYGLNDAAAMIQPGTGNIIAIGQNTAYSNKSGPQNTSLNLAAAGFTFGSSAKFFSMVTALQNGTGAANNYTIDVPKITTKNADGQRAASFRYRDFDGPCYTNSVGSFPISNDDDNTPAGPMSYARATAWSVNTAFTKLAEQAGMCNIVDTMVKLGLNKSELSITPAGVVLGTGLTSPIQLATAYATAAAGGKYCPPRPVVSITNANGKKLPLSGVTCKQVIPPAVAAQTTKIFEAVLNPADNNATGHKAALADGRPAAGKTGTVSGAKNIWFVGYTPQLATAVWVGHGKGGQPDIKNVTLAGQSYSGAGGYVFAGDLAAPIWKTLMDAALQGQPIKQFPAASALDSATNSPSSTSSGPTAVAVPNVVGQSVTSAISLLHAAGFHVQLGPSRSGSQPRGEITAMSASSGTAAQGTTITIYPSNGSGSSATSNPTSSPAAPPSKPTPSSSPTSGGGATPQ